MMTSQLFVAVLPAVISAIIQASLASIFAVFLNHKEGENVVMTKRFLGGVVLVVVLSFILSLSFIWYFDSRDDLQIRAVRFHGNEIIGKTKNLEQYKVVAYGKAIGVDNNLVLIDDGTKMSQLSKGVYPREWRLNISSHKEKYSELLFFLVPEDFPAVSNIPGRYYDRYIGDLALAKDVMPL